MNTQELKEKLRLIGVGESNYSINGFEKPDTFIFRDKGTIWEVFYLDERGGKNEFKEFYSECDAYEYFFQRFQSLYETGQKLGITMYRPI